MHAALRLTIVIAATTLFACKEGPPEIKGGPTPPPSAMPASSDEENAASQIPKANVQKPEPPAEKFPLNDQQLQKILNPAGATEYTGPTGVIEGTITVKGDPPAMRTFQTLPKECEGAKAIHGPAYRAGPKGELADALIGVRTWTGYVRPSKDDKVITIKNCSIEPTVIDLSLGQRLMIGNVDAMPYMPQTAAKMIVRRLAIKDMSPVPLILTEPAAYGLTWLTGTLPGADVPTVTVFVIPNALHTVTGIDGKYRITGVPVGKAHISASHLGMDEAGKDVMVEAGKELKLDLTLNYKSATPPAASASAKPPAGKPIH
jgi:hypothetical protein